MRADFRIWGLLPAWVIMCFTLIIPIVIVIAGMWRPVPILIATLVFSFLDALQLQIQGIGIAVVAGLTKQQFDDTVGIHPTAAEEFVTMREPARRAPCRRARSGTRSAPPSCSWCTRAWRTRRRTWRAKRSAESSSESR